LQSTPVALALRERSLVQVQPPPPRASSSVGRAVRGYAGSVVGSIPTERATLAVVVDGHVTAG
jgi:hypothetical protein